MNGLLRTAWIGSVALLVLPSCHRGTSEAQRPIDGAPLVRALMNAKQPPAAIASVEQAASQADGCRFAEVAARAALDADLHGLVQPLLDAAPRHCPRASLLLGQSAEARARDGQKDAAKQRAAQAMTPDPKNSYAELALARVAYDENQMNVCREHATKARALGRGAEADRLLGRTELALGNVKDAEAHFQNVLSVNPNDAEAAFSAAVCNERLGHYSAAREGFLQTLRINPDHVAARKYLVLLTFRAGAKAEARHHLQKLTQIVPKDSPLLSELQPLLANDGADAGTTTTP